MTDERLIPMPESLVQAILDNLKQQPYDQVFQLIAQVMRVAQSQPQLSPDDPSTTPTVPGDS